MLYTVEVRKRDKRVKGGLRFVKKIELDCATKGEAEDRAQLQIWKEQGSMKGGYVYTVFETMVTRKNMMTGNEYQERYDTPHYCSPSSESYWSM